MCSFAGRLENRTFCHFGCGSHAGLVGFVVALELHLCICDKMRGGNAPSAQPPEFPCPRRPDSITYASVGGRRGGRNGLWWRGGGAGGRGRPQTGPTGFQKGSGDTNEVQWRDGLPPDGKTTSGCCFQVGRRDRQQTLAPRLSGLLVDNC